MNSLIIGENSQISKYLPIEYERISARNIDLKLYEDKFYDRVFICFAEQRTFLNDYDLFYEINVELTSKIIKFFQPKCNKLIYYSTSELWNNIEGGINVNMNYDYFETPYIKTKHIMSDIIHNLDCNNIIVLYPYNFNSPYRRDGFLFSKIFNSIIKEEKVSIGNVNFYRDLIHPKYLASISLNCDKDEIVGSGRLVNVQDFIYELYDFFQMKLNDFIIFDDKNSLKNKRKINYLDSFLPKYTKLKEDTIYDIRKFKNILS